MPTAQRPWREPEDLIVPAAFREELDLGLGTATHPILAEILLRRGYTRANHALRLLDPDTYQPCSPSELPGLNTAIERIRSAIDEGELICIWGDFDVDGQTSTALLVEAVRDLGGNVRHYIPVRATESHGVHISSLARVIDSGATLIVTCDTGISANDAIAYANSRNVDVIVTDHHEPPEVLPPASVLINPHFVPEDHPLHALPGVGVAYKLAEGLFREAGKEGEVEQFLDLAALGIIADVALLSGDTRYLAQRGLAKLRNTHRNGLQALYDLAEVTPGRITEEQIGFTIAPRLNALGRLSDANSAVEFLTTKDHGRAYLLAIELEGLNAERQLLSEQVFQSALAQIDHDPSLLNHNILLLDNHAWPTGIVGIVASRLVDLYGKPVLLVTAPPGTLARGSARSIPGVNIIKAIREQSGLLNSFGGHAMAAGLSLENSQIGALRIGLSKSIERQVGQYLPVLPIQVDAFTELADLSIDMVADLFRLAPFGLGNPQVILATKNLQLVSQRTIGRAKEHLLVSVSDQSGVKADIIWWQGAHYPPVGERFDLAYTVHASDYRGKPGVQMTWVASRNLAPSPIQIGEVSEIDWIDLRESTIAETDLATLQKEYPNAQVWAEGGLMPGNQTSTCRSGLALSEILIIWTIPPSRFSIQQAIQTVRPKKVVLFSKDPGLDEVQVLAQRLSGLVKYALNHYDGIVELSQLAERCAHQEPVVRLCLEWLKINKVFHWSYLPDQKIQAQVALTDIREPDLIERSNLALYKLQAALAETKAFRSYYRTAPVDSLR